MCILELIDYNRSVVALVRLLQEKINKYSNRVGTSA
jgi:hypothetical protein